MGRRDIRGRYGRMRRARASGLPPDLVALLATDSKKRMWRAYLPLWTGAVAIGLAVGAGPILLRSEPTVAGQPQPTTAIQTRLDERPTAQDQEWAARASESAVAPSQSAPTKITLAATTTTFGFCHTGGGTNCVVDGDTLWIDGQKVRVADIDAPETHDFHCQAEKDLGDRATQRLIQLVNSGAVTLQPIDRDEDRYGRKLRLVLVNGASVGDALVSEGLARYYEGGRRPWC